MVVTQEVPLFAELGEYLFVEENVENERGKTDMKHIEEIKDFFKVLGCYRNGLNY